MNPDPFINGQRLKSNTIWLLSVDQFFMYTLLYSTILEFIQECTEKTVTTRAPRSLLSETLCYSVGIDGHQVDG